ncbi:integrase [Thermococcus prieurii virus 1]|uniref:integrase n=1 Tax=Thermococcus prieurii virus 1 TaxID=1115696 RepID=UPI00024FB210|nr:integrase [Thermococcus prieurii virus 1]AEY69059.1 SSV family integrase [Thermococcus prieurii virus 1]AFA44822.1 SSV1-type integrase [Thermococcus prieurii virus 1]
MNEMGINKSQFFNDTARWVFLGEEMPEIIVKLEWCGGRDLNPGHRLGRSLSLNEMWVAYRAEFEKALLAEVAETTAKDYLSALNRFFGAHKIKTTEDLRNSYLKEGQKRNLGKGLRKFFTFLYQHDAISFELYQKLKNIIKLKPTKASGKFITTGELLEAYDYFRKHGRPEELLLFRILAYSGIRLRHAVQLLNSFSRDKLIYHENFAKYPLFKHEGTKVVYYAYMPRELAEELFQSGYTEDMARKYLRYGKVSASTIRKWFSTFLVSKGVPPAAVNYIQGRKPKNVLDAYYVQLEKLADEAYSRVLPDLKKVLEDGE